MVKARVVGYIRVSTAQQADEGVSLDAQRAKLEAYALALDLDLVAIEADEGVSAKSLARPGLQRALQRLETGEADGLLVAKLDRLTRSVRDLDWLIAPDRFGGRWQLLSVADSIDTRSAAGRLVLNVLASVLQWEREAIGERTRDALRHLQRQGVRLGAVPLGLTRTATADEHGRLTFDPVTAERSTVARMAELRLDGQSYRAIAERLTAEQHATKRGGRWQAETVRKVLTRELARAPMAAE